MMKFWRQGVIWRITQAAGKVLNHSYICLDLASLICLSDEFMPGSVLQASSPSNKAWKSYIQVNYSIGW